jgi:hypothetical protein
VVAYRSQADKSSLNLSIPVSQQYGRQATNGVGLGEEGFAAGVNLGDLRARLDLPKPLGCDPALLAVRPSEDNPCPIGAVEEGCGDQWERLRRQAAPLGPPHPYPDRRTKDEQEDEGDPGHEEEHSEPRG